MRMVSRDACAPVKCASGAAILTIKWLDGDHRHARTLYRNPARREALDELLSDAVMAPVLRSAGYEPDEFREMMTEMAPKLVTPSEGGKAGLLY